MRRVFILLFLSLLATYSSAKAKPKDDATRVRDAAKLSTLDQEGTKPFHLKATLTPSQDRDRDSGRTGEVEIWWESPTRYRREVRSPGFHQIQIVDDNREWQKSEGDYFPEWLRETAVAIVRPLPDLDQALKRVSEADVRHLMGSTYFQWWELSSNGDAKKGMGGSVALTDKTGLLLYAGSLDWGGLYKDYAPFHDRMVARTVANGTPEVTATVTTLEDLQPTSDLFDTNEPGGDKQPLHTISMDELESRQHLVLADPPEWPPVKNVPFEGTLTTKIVIDRSGVVREVGTIVSDNQSLNAAAREYVGAMRFKPFVVDGNPVQVITRITMRFKTNRPEEIKPE